MSSELSRETFFSTEPRPTVTEWRKIHEGTKIWFLAFEKLHKMEGEVVDEGGDKKEE